MLRIHHFAAIACLQGSLLLGNVPALGQITPSEEGTSSLPEAIEPSLDGIVDLAETDMPLGVGYLAPESPLEKPRLGQVQPASWLTQVELPLYSEAGGEHWGWLWQGWLIPNGQQAFAIGRDASFTMVGVEPEVLAFTILQARDDGWMQMQYTDGGSAWIHSDQFDDRGLELAFYSWEDGLVDADTLSLRDTINTQVLRSEPERGRNVLSLVSTNSLIEPLEVQDDWIRVRVTRPANGCEPLAGASEEEGWLQWKNSDGEVLMVPSQNECSS